MAKENNEDFKNFIECWICDNYYIDNDVEVRDHCRVSVKYTVSVHRDCNINLKLNHKIHIVFHNLRNHDSHLIMQELDKFILKISVIANELEIYMSFTIINKLSFIDSFQIRSFSLDSMVKNLNEDDLSI